MTAPGLLQIFLFFLVLLALTKPLGVYMARVFEGERTFLHPVVRPFERLVYKLSGVDEAAEQHWTHYAGSLLAFSLAGCLLTYLILSDTGYTAVQPAGLPGQIVDAGPRVQYGGHLHHEHELASLHAGNNRQLLLPDGRFGHA